MPLYTLPHSYYYTRLFPRITPLGCVLTLDLSTCRTLSSPFPMFCFVLFCFTYSRPALSHMHTAMKKNKDSKFYILLNKKITSYVLRYAVVVDIPRVVHGYIKYGKNISCHLVISKKKREKGTNIGIKQAPYTSDSPREYKMFVVFICC